MLINVHLANLGRPGTYAEEVKKGLRTANLSEVNLPNDVDSGAIVQIIPPHLQNNLQITHPQSSKL